MSPYLKMNTKEGYNMSVYKTNRCPYCNQAIETVLKNIVHKEKFDNNFGNPIKECPYCKKKYLDNKMLEPALMSPSDLFFKGLVTAFSILAVSVALSILIGSYISRLISGDINLEVDDAVAIKVILPLIILFLAIGLKRFWPWNFKSDINASLERLKNEDYARTLIKLNKNIISPNSLYAKNLESKKIKKQE